MAVISALISIYHSFETIDGNNMYSVKKLHPKISVEQLEEENKLEGK